MSGYVTIAEADLYINTHYLSTDSIRINWNNLSDEDKEVVLTVSADAIDSLPWPGRKLDPNQERAFPRYPDADVPIFIHEALIENAATVTDSSSSDEALLYQRMWSYGISSYRIGNLSETVGTAGGNSGLNVTMIQNGIVSTKAQALLKPFLGGAYRIE